MMKIAILLLILLLAALVTWHGMRQLRNHRERQRAITKMLDAADTLESRLRTARSEIEAVAGDHENPVRAAMQDLLRQRMWMQEHAMQASLSQLDEVRASLDAASASLDLQLQQIHRARTGAAVS